MGTADPVVTVLLTLVRLVGIGMTLVLQADMSINICSCCIWAVPQVPLSAGSPLLGHPGPVSIVFPSINGFGTCLDPQELQIHECDNDNFWG